MINQKSRKAKEKNLTLRGRALLSKSHITSEDKNSAKVVKNKNVKSKAKVKSQDLKFLIKPLPLKSKLSSSSFLLNEPKLNNSFNSNECDQELKKAKCTSKAINRKKDGKSSNLKLDLNNVNDIDSRRKCNKKLGVNSNSKVFNALGKESRKKKVNQTEIKIKTKKKVKAVDDLIKKSNLIKFNKTSVNKSNSKLRQFEKNGINVKKSKSNFSTKSLINSNTLTLPKLIPTLTLTPSSLSSSSLILSSLSSFSSKPSASQSSSKKKILNKIKKLNSSANKKNKSNQTENKKQSKQNNSKSKSNFEVLKKETSKLKKEKDQSKQRSHRMASLNATCKVHLLFESEKEKFDENNVKSLVIKSTALIDEKNEKKKNISLSLQPSKTSLKTLKKNSELVPYNNSRQITKKRKSIHDEIEIIDTRSCKRMASLNASAILAASYLPEKIAKKSPSSHESLPSPLTACVEMIQETKISSSISRVEVTPNFAPHTVNGDSLVVESKKTETIEMIKQVRRVSGKIRDRLLAIEMMERENNKNINKTRLINNGQKLIKNGLNKGLCKKKLKEKRKLDENSLNNGQAQTGIRTEYKVTKVQINTNKGSSEKDKKKSHKIETILEKDAIVRKYQIQTKATSQSYRVQLETSTYNPIITNVISSSNLHSVPCIPLHSSVNELHLRTGSNGLNNSSLLINQGLNHNSCYSYPNQSVLQLLCNTPYSALSPSSATLNQLPVLNIGPQYTPHYTSAFSVPHYPNHNTASLSYSPESYGFYQSTASIIQPVHDHYLRTFSVHKPVPFHATPLTHHSEQGFKSNGFEQVLPHNNQPHMTSHYQSSTGPNIAQALNSFIIQCPSNEFHCQPSSNNLYQLAQPTKPIMISSEIPVNIALNNQTLLIQKDSLPKSSSASFSMLMPVASYSTSVPPPVTTSTPASPLNPGSITSPTPSTSSPAASTFVSKTATAVVTTLVPNTASVSSSLPISSFPLNSNSVSTTPTSNFQSNFFSTPYSNLISGSSYDTVSNANIGIGSCSNLMSHPISSSLHTQVREQNTFQTYNLQSPQEVMNNISVCENPQIQASKSVQCTPFNLNNSVDFISATNSFQAKSFSSSNSSLCENMNANLDVLKKFSKKNSTTNKKSSLFKLKVNPISNNLNKNSTYPNCLLNKKKLLNSSKNNQALTNTDNFENTNCGVLNKKTGKKRYSHSWSWKGYPVKKPVHVKADDPPQIRDSYSAMCHSQGDIIRVGDCVLLRSGPRKNDLHFVAKVCALWEAPDTGEMMMTLLWYYRPEHTEAGRKPSNIPEEIFASKHRDVNNVACIDDKCYVLTYNEYCRHRKSQKMTLEKIKKSLTDVIVPKPKEEYFRKSRLPPGQVCPDRVLVCRKVYDFRLKRTLKNPA